MNKLLLLLCLAVGLASQPALADQAFPSKRVRVIIPFPPGQGSDILARAIGDKLAQLPAGHVNGPVDQHYGQRELMIRAPDGNVLVFGQSVERS